jgi:ArsR family transcriptional regulator
VGELSDALQISQSNCSQHLAILRDRGMVTAERSGTSVSYELRSEKVVQAVDLLREFMAEELGTRSKLGRAATRLSRGQSRR